MTKIKTILWVLVAILISASAIMKENIKAEDETTNNKNKIIKSIIKETPKVTNEIKKEKKVIINKVIKSKKLKRIKPVVYRKFDHSKLFFIKNSYGSKGRNAIKKGLLKIARDSSAIINNVDSLLKSDSTNNTFNTDSVTTIEKDSVSSNNEYEDTIMKSHFNNDPAKTFIRNNENSDYAMTIDVKNQ